METERRLGFDPTDRELEKRGYDIESRVPTTGALRFLEVKGRRGLRMVRRARWPPGGRLRQTQPTATRRSTPVAYAFRNARGDRLTRQGVTYLLQQACQRARERRPSLAAKRVSPHVVRHTTAMHLLQAGVDVATIALWLGHERLETTHQYIEADLELKKRALRQLEPLGQRAGRFKPDASLLTFLAGL